MKKEILFSITKKDFDIKPFSGKGGGGQHRNKHQNCIRMKHRDSGAMAVGQSHRSKEQNTREAFLRIVNSDKFKKWHKIECARRNLDREEFERQLNREVDEMMQERYLKVETFEPEELC